MRPKPAEVEENVGSELIDSELGSLYQKVSLSLVKRDKPTGALQR